MGTQTQEGRTLNKELLWQWMPLCLAGCVPAYFATSFLTNFHSEFYQFILISLTSLTIFGMGTGLLLENPNKGLIDRLNQNWTATLILVLACLLAISAFAISWQFPGLFAWRILIMDSTMTWIFVAFTVLTMGGMTILLGQTKVLRVFESINSTSVFRFFRENIPGLALSSFFFLVYFTFAETINFPNFRTLDQFFDTDISLWLARLLPVSPNEVPEIRAVHPAFLLFLRPVVWLVSLFLNGDRLQAIFLIHAAMGASCVFLTWIIVKQSSSSATYSLIMAFILGISTSHLLLSSMIETYIYSAFALILFTLLIQRESKFIIPVGVLVFGITVTNIIQTCIQYFLKSPNIKTIAKYILAVTLLVIILNIVQVSIYPSASSLLEPSQWEREQNYRFNLAADSWRVAGRVSLILRALLLYGIVAPKPFILMEELAINVPNFRTFQITIGQFHVAGYTGVADVTVKFWIFILGIAIVLFSVQTLRSPKKMGLQLGFLLCLAFNFILHVAYGDDPMLYSPDWVYALVLFAAFSLQEWADRRWLQLTLIAFLFLIAVSNLKLIHQIMQVSAPFYSR